MKLSISIQVVGEDSSELSNTSGRLLAWHDCQPPPSAPLPQYPGCSTVIGAVQLRSCHIWLFGQKLPGKRKLPSAANLQAISSRVYEKMQARMLQPEAHWQSEGHDLAYVQS